MPALPHARSARGGTATSERPAGAEQAKDTAPKGPPATPPGPGGASSSEAPQERLIVVPGGQHARSF